MPISDEDWARQIQAESSGNQAAVSPKGAVGVAQVMRKTGPEAAALAGLPWDERLWKTDAVYNERIGRAYMDKQVEDFGGDLDMARAAYNAGPDRVRRIVAAKGENWRDFLPDETKKYVAKLGGGAPMASNDPDMALLNQFRKPRGGPSEQFSTEDLLEKIGGVPRAAQTATAPAAGAASPASPNQPGGAPSTIPTQRTDMGEPRSTAQKAGRAVLSAVGGLAGGVGGALVGGPLGGIAGAGLGSAAGSYASETFDPSEHPGREALIEGAFGAAGQGIGGIFGKLIPTSIRPGGRELVRLLGKDLPTPGQVFDSKAMEVLHNVGMSSFIGADSLERATQAALSGARRGAMDYQAQVAANLDLGAEALNQVSMAASRLNASANIGPIKAAAQAVARNTPADSGVRNVARVLLETEGNNIPFSVPLDDVMKNAMWNATPGVTPVAGKGTVGLKELRTQLMDIYRNSTDTAERTAAMKLADLVDAAAERALSKADPRLATQWREASAFYKEGIQGEEIGQMFSKALISGGEKGEISGKLLQNALKEHRLDALKTPLTQQQIDHLDMLAKALSAAEGSGSKAFMLVSNGLQVNAIVRTAIAAGAITGGGALATGSPSAGAGAAAATVLLGPAAIAKALASPNVMRLMIAMSRMPQSHKAAGTLGTQLISQMFREGILTADEQPSADTPQGQPPTSGTPPPR